MNCQQLEKVIGDLTNRVSIMDASERESASTHIKECARCAARLADEKALTAGLRAMAKIEETEPAPSSQLEANLLAAFRARTAAIVPAVGTAPVIEFQKRSRAWFHHWTIGGAIAATIVFVMMLFGLNVLRSNQNKELQRANQERESQGNQRDSATAENAAKDKNLAGPAKESRIDVTAQSGDEQKVAFDRRKTDQRHFAVKRKKRERNYEANEPRMNSEEAAEVYSDIATEFMPITHGTNLNNIDGGQIIRVELPRTALISFGLPMNMERANERVKADVVLGSDGLARAIRFVR